MKAMDLTGQIFGELEAIMPETIKEKRGWHCRCSCGAFTWVPTFQLRSGNNRTCGGEVHRCTIKVGDKFGLLTVQRIHRDLKNRRYMTDCSCDCGGYKLKVSAKNLQRGATRSCGCLKTVKKLRQPVEISARNKLIATYKGNAKTRNLDFTLSVEECEILFKGECYFCGKPPSRPLKGKGIYGEYLYSGIDRIDSSKGYIQGNVASCCTECNLLKINKSNEEFLSHIFRIAAYQRTE